MNSHKRRSLINSQGITHLFLLVALGIILFLLIAATAPFKNRILGQLFFKNSSFASTLPTPTNIVTEQDDRNTIVKWDDHDTHWPLNGKPDGVVGYVLYWGVLDQNTNTIINPIKKLTEDTILQLQPLTEGVKYGVYVQSVDTLGNVSAPSQTISFQSDSTRVNTLRTQMN